MSYLLLTAQHMIRGEITGVNIRKLVQMSIYEVDNY